MDKEKLINKVCNELVHGKNIDFTFEINGIPYSIKFLSPNNDLHISIPSIIAVPLTQKFNNQLIFEQILLNLNNHSKIFYFDMITLLFLLKTFWLVVLF